MKSFAAALLGLALAAEAFAQGAPQPVWSARYGPASGYDAAGAIAADGQGNVYVGGTSPAAASASSFVVIKYGASGTREWVARHSGTGGKALSVAIDGRGNVFAAGFRWANPYFEEVVLKFDPNGRELWWRRLSGRATKLLPDPAGNLYVIGRHSDGYDDDWSVIKFSPDGGLAWEIRYDHAQGFNDEPANAMFDTAGNVIVAGTVGADPDGSRPGDVSVAKYSPDGVVLWQVSYGQADSHEFVDDFGIDQSGTIYLIGGHAVSGSIYAPAVELWLKYSPEGALIGETLGGETPNGGFGTAVVDRDGNLYATTFSRLTKHSPAGALLWGTEFTSPPFGVTIPIVQLSPTGEVVVGATSFDGSYNGDYLIYAFDAAGTMRWRYRFNGPVNGDDTLEGLCVDGVGNVIVTGTSWNNYASIGGSADDMVTLKFGAFDPARYSSR